MEKEVKNLEIRFKIKESDHDKVVEKADNLGLTVLAYARMKLLESLNSENHDSD